MKLQILILAALLGGCGGGDDTPSTGLKIFVTAETHSGDFAGDPKLPGTNAIQKADAFCNQSSAKPSDDTYKALFVDGVSRDAVSLTDWVLKPNTNYYQAFNDVLIDKTSNAALFTAYYSPLQHPINGCGNHCPEGTATQVWTGIDDASTFAASPNVCNQWGQVGSVSNSNGAFASTLETGYYAFASNGGAASCSTTQLALYCVQQ